MQHELSSLSKIYAIACDTGTQLETGGNGDDGANERHGVEAALHSYRYNMSALNTLTIQKLTPT